MSRSKPVWEWRGGGLARHFSFLSCRVTQPMLAASAQADPVQILPERVKMLG
jgi:hypothetical protein